MKLRRHESNPKEYARLYETDCQSRLRLDLLPVAITSLPIPPAIDGKRHDLRVALTKEAKEKHKGVRLRFRPELR